MKKNYISTLIVAVCLLFPIGMLTATANAQETITEDFETAEAKSGYVLETVTLASGDWQVAGVINPDDNDHSEGTKSVRFRGRSSSSDDHFVAMNFDKTGGIGIVSFKYASYGSHSNGVLQVQYSADGTTWVDAGSQITVPAWGTAMLDANVEVNNADAKRIKIKKIAGANSTSVNVDNITITSFSGTITSVATPTFSPSSGSYFESQSVTISTTTDEASIYYTLNGDDPTTSSTLYVEGSPITISATTTIKAIAVKDGLDDSSIATATYTFPAEIATIAELRQQAEGSSIYKLTGEAVLTLKSSNRNVKYIQDATDAIVIDDYSGTITTGYALGDGITGIVGTLSTYNGMLQFVPQADPGAATSSGNTIDPVEVSLDNLSSHPAKLVTVKNVTITDTITDSTGKFVASRSYLLNDNENIVLRTQYADLDYIGEDIPTGAVDITGVVLIYNTDTKETTQLVPRSFFEIIPASDKTVSVLSASIYAKDGKIHVSGTDAATIKVYNLQGQLIVAATNNASINEITVPTGQLYIVKVGADVAKVLVK